ncbi:MAG: glycosyltransferase, partial [Bacteroidota bacterium]
MNSSRHRKKVLFILGMHRSGTSALAGCIHLSGISGGREMLEPAFDNEKGFFENRQVFQINEGILAELGLRWDSPFDLPGGWVSEARLRKHKQAIANFLTSELMNRPALYVKDPRLCFLMPLWLEVLKELEVESASIVIVRHPAEVFHSLRRRNNLDKNKALSLWLNHLLQAEKNSRNTPRRLLFYNDLLEKPVATVEQVLRDFQLLPPEKDWQNRRTAIQDFIDKKLKHHDAARNSDGMERLPYFPTLLDLMEKLAGAPNDPAVLAELDRQRELFDFNLRFFTPAPKQDFFATLKLECGEKTRLVAPLQLPVFEGLERLVFDLSHVAAPIENALLFPCDALCHVAFTEVSIAYADGSSDAFEPARRKVLIEHGVEFLFEPQDFVIVEPKPGKQVESITFHLVYKNIGEAALAKVTDFTASIRAWFSERLAQQATDFEAEKSRSQQQFQQAAGQLEQQAEQFQKQAEQHRQHAGQVQQENEQFKKENELLQSMLEVEKKLVETLEGQLKSQQAAAWELDRQLQSAYANLREKTVQIIDLQEKVEAGSRALADEKQQTEALTSRLETEKQAHQSTRREYETTIQAYESTRQAHESAQKEIEATHRQLETARRENDASKLEIEAAKRDLAAARLVQKQKEDLIWELFSKNQKLETDYRQALVTLGEERSSVSYRLGRFLTAPLRWIFDVFSSKKPFNETGLWLFLQFLLAALAMPGRLLAHVNGKNISTLRKALKNESPRQIAGNLRKLLDGNGAAPPVLDASQNHLSESSKLSERSASTPSGGNHLSKSLELSERSAALPARENHLSESLELSERLLPPSYLTPHTSSLKKTVLFCSPNLPDFDASSGGKRATRLLELLAQDCEVYAFTLGNKPENHARKLEAAGVRVFQITDFQEVKQVLPQVDVLIFSFFYTYFDCGEFLKLYPNAKLVADTVDVHWVRHERSIGLWEELTEEVVRKKKALEIEVYRKAEVIWAVTQFDKQAILAEVPEADVCIVSNVHPVEVPAWKDPGNNNLLFFGGFAHYPNIIAAKELVFRIFPKIREQVPDAKLLIAGSNAPLEIEELGKLPGVEFLGFVDEDQLADLYRQSFLALVPLQTGAGIKGKICEAIAYGIPVVTNKIGNEGIELVNEESGLISNDKNELVRLTVKALRREYDFVKMVAAAQERMGKLVGSAVVKKNMMESLASPGVSICIVTWNKQALLQRCIESIENHTHYPHYQILVYSNGCTDGTQAYLEAAAKINPRIVPVLSQTNDV